MTKEEVIESAVADIFSSGEGAKAIRLKMVFDDNEHGTGWGKPAIADKLRAVYDAALNERWTYCDDRLPEAEESGYYFATRKTESGRVYTWQTHFSQELQSWSVTGNEHVIAWRPLPEPAKGREV